jgi:hypothetical protein
MGPDAPLPSAKLTWRLTDWPPHVDMMTNQQFSRLRTAVSATLLVILALLAASLGTVVNSNAFRRAVWGKVLFGPQSRPSDG